MSVPVSTLVSNSHLVFGDFLESLRLHGFTIGVGHHLRLQKLLSRVGPECRPHELKTLLCPIFATDEREQTRFYEEFDEFFDFEYPSVESGAEPVERVATDVVREVAHAQSRTSNKRKWIVLSVGLALFVGVLLLPWAFQGPVPFDFPTPSPTPEDILTAATPTPTPFTTLLFNSLEIEVSTLVRIFVALLPLLLFLLYELFRRLRQRQRRQQLNDREQPGIPIGFKTSLAEVYDADSITRLARLLRTRQRSGTLQLDIAASIAATVKALGFFTLREKSTSQPPEYLVLIDRAAFRDHQARLFYELARKLYAESVFLTCYFFEGDPRVSFMSPFVSVSATPLVRTAEAQQKLEEEARRAQRGATIEDLNDLYPGHRLIIFGEGEDLVDPVTLQTVDWIKSFAHWQERAILTPRPRSLWDAHEFALRQQFVVMPATLTGLELAAESFAIREPVSIPENLRGDKSSPPHSIDSVEGLRELRQYLGEQTFQWLCACAVHPQLQWDLTICLGLQFSTRENLFTEENLLRLFSLPWFRAGVIPDAAREKLMRELSAGSEAKVRQTIAELMERAAAAETLAEGPDVVRVPLPQEVETSVPEEFFKRIRNVRDVTFKRFLQPKPFVLFLKRVLPGGLQRLLFTPFGMRLGTRVALALLVSLILWAAFPTIASAFDFSATSTNTNTNTNVNTNINYNANENYNYNTNYNENVNANVNLNVNLNINQFPSPSPSASPRIRPSPSPTVAPSPPVTPSPSPRTSPNPQAGITGFSVDRTTIRPGEKVTLRYAFRNATDIIIVPQDGALEALNQRFASITNRLQDQSGTVVVQPEKTTTYIITADIHVGFDQAIRRERREVTVTVRDDSTTDLPGEPCTPMTFDLGRLNDAGDTIHVTIRRSCYNDPRVPVLLPRWTIFFTYSSKSTPSRTYDYTEQGGGYAIQKLASNGLSSEATRSIISNVLPALRSGDSQQVSRAIRYMLTTVN